MKLHGGHAHHPHPHVSSDAYDSTDSKESCAAISFSEESESSGMESEGWSGDVWDNEKLQEYIQAKPGRCVVVVGGYAVDVTKYMGEHVSLFRFTFASLIQLLTRCSLVGRRFYASILSVQSLVVTRSKKTRGRSKMPTLHSMEG